MGSRVKASSLDKGGAAAKAALDNPALSAYVAELGREAELYRARVFPGLTFSAYKAFDERGDRGLFEGAYFERRRALVALALASWLWKRGADLEALENLIWTICDEYAWALPAHLGGTSLDPACLHPETLDLFACETAFALAEICSILQGFLTPIVAERARREVERRVLMPFIARSEPWPWELMRNNWCAVCAGSVGAAALYLVRDEARFEAILARTLPTLERFLESFPEDGACLEGLGYWTYGVGFYVAFAELLEESGRGAGLLEGEKFRRIAAFQAKAYLNDHLALSFADGSPGERFRIGLTAFLARGFPEARVPAPALAASFSHDRCGRWCLSFRDLLWTRAERGGASLPQASDREAVDRGCYWLPDAQWLIYPAAHGGGLAFAAKGGHNDEPHNHNDVGSFELVFGDCQLLADLGPGEYTRDYFNENRYSIFCNSSLSHNLPIVEGRGQEAGPMRRASGALFRGEGGKATLSMDIAAAYDCPSLIGLRRSFEFDGSSLLTLRDEFALSRPGIELIERFVTPLPLSAIRRVGGGLLLESGGARLLISSLSPGILPVLSEREHRSHEGRTEIVVCMDFALPRMAASVSAEFEFRLERA